MKSNSHSPVTEMLSAKYKIWLTVGLVGLFVSDLVACICLWADGVPSSYWLFPFIFALVDGLYMLGVIFSNQRFKYAFKMLIVYTIITVAEIVIWIIMLTAGDDVVFNNMSAAFWAIIHLLGLIAAVIAYVYASKRFKFAHAAQLSIAIVSVVIAVLLMLLYLISLASAGFFGQGSGIRPLIYAETEDGSGYIVTGVMDGKGDTAAVPNEFNDKKIIAVSYNVFSAKGLKRINLGCDADTLFTDALEVDGADIADISKDLRIYAPIETADVFRKKFYTDAVHGSLTENYKGMCFALGNRVTPVVPSDEVYVTFDYDYDSYLRADENVIPMWHGKKDSALPASHIADFEYAVHSDNTNADDLYARYNHNQYIMRELSVGDNAIVGSKVSASANVKVSFDRVHYIIPGTTNDTMYDVTSAFPYATVNGTEQEFTLTVAEHADDILSAFTRDGFSVRWTYSHETQTDISFTSLAELLADSNIVGKVAISPLWTLAAPTVDIKPTDDKTTVTYGDAYTLTAEAAHTVDGAHFDYAWFKDGNRLGSGNEWSTSSMPFDGYGNYTVAVAVTAPEVTSLSSSEVKDITVTVARRELTVEWTDPEGTVDGHVTYNGKNQTITPTLHNTVGNDSAYVNISSFAYADAGVHECNVILAGDRASRYYIKPGDESHTITIDPFAVDVQWDNVVDGKVEFTYNGKKQAPEAHSYANWSPIHSTKLSVEVTGEQIDANSSGGTYTATARLIKYWVAGHNIEDTNYTIKSGKTQTFVIKPLEINVVWGDRTSFEYDGEFHAPTARANGEPNDTGGYKELIMTVDGAKVNAGTGYVATARHVSANYTVSESTQSKPFVITQKPITLDWTSAALTYNGESQAPTPSVDDVNGNPLSLSVTGKQTNAGADYVATAALSAELDRQNYDITNPERTYTIAAREITVAWVGYTLTYNGASQQPNAIATGVNNLDLPVNVSVAGEHVNAATYTAVVTFADIEHLNNYSISNPTREFTIRKRDLTAAWGNRSLEYNGTAQKPTATVVGVSGAITVAVSVTEAEHTNVGSYNATVSCVDALDIQNYNITNNAATFSIYAKGVEIVWTDTALTYNGNPQAPTASAQGVNGPLTVTVLGERTNASTTAYTATASIGDTNYLIHVTTVSHSFTISPLAVGIDWGTTSFEYDGKPHAPTATVNGVSGALDITVDGAQTNVGDYTATATLKNSTDRNNYTLTNPARSYSVTAKSVTVTVNDLTVEYGETPVYSYTATGFVGADGSAITVSCTVSYTADEDGNIPSGTYSITATVTGVSSNYAVTVNPGMLTVGEKPESDEQSKGA